MKESMKSTFMLSISSHNCYLVMHIITGTSTDFTSSNAMEMKPYSCNIVEIKLKSDIPQSSENVNGEPKSCGFETSVAETENEKPPITGR